MPKKNKKLAEAATVKEAYKAICKVIYLQAQRELEVSWRGPIKRPV